jgi:adenylate cyclase
MMDESRIELVKRIAKLAKQNQVLTNQLRLLTEKYEKLSQIIDDSGKLIKNVIPASEISKEIDDTSIHLKIKTATVLFADIHGFRKISGEVNPDILIDELDKIFLQFDGIVKKYNIKKIKTIGDTYMCVGGIPEKNITNPIQVVLAAIEMQQLINNLKSAYNNNQSFWEIRIGLHSGPLSADVVGKKKFTYDIKGDTVNISHRIESSCDLNHIVISAMTYEMVKEFFVCEYFGKLPVKYKGNLELFVVKGINSELSVGGLGEVPNADFQTKYSLIQFTDLQEVILDKMEKELPKYLHYHNVKHTVDVVTEVELIGWAEGLNDGELLIIKTAALFHDIGHVVGYENHEYYGTQIAREMLPKYNYSKEQIEQICKIIMATKLPPDPKNLSEEIICDSDLDYLGRSDFIPVSNLLYEELKTQNKISSLNEWNKLQIKFISSHQYFTKTAQGLREVNKQKQIDRISKLIEG